MGSIVYCTRTWSEQRQQLVYYTLFVNAQWVTHHGATHLSSRANESYICCKCCNYYMKPWNKSIYLYREAHIMIFRPSRWKSSPHQSHFNIVGPTIRLSTWRKHDYCNVCNDAMSNSSHVFNHVSSYGGLHFYLSKWNSSIYMLLEGIKFILNCPNQIIFDRVVVGHVCIYYSHDPI